MCVCPSVCVYVCMSVSVCVYVCMRVHAQCMPLCTVENCETLEQCSCSQTNPGTSLPCASPIAVVMCENAASQLPGCLNTGN